MAAESRFRHLAGAASLKNRFRAFAIIFGFLGLAA
jgi:hypothetical protein